MEDALEDLQGQLLMAQQAQMAQGGGPRVTEEQLQNGHPLAMLLRTLLPWVNVEEEEAQQADRPPNNEPQ